MRRDVIDLARRSGSRRIAIVACICLLVISPLIAGETDKRPAPPPMCRDGLIVDCILDYEDVIWTTSDQKNCNVTMNRCLFNNHNCYRYRNGLPLLKEIPKEECQRMCIKDCPTASSENQICARRGSNYCQFQSECELNKHICSTGEMWIPELNKFCEMHKNESKCP